jgi:hypothetical protein
VKKKLIAVVVITGLIAVLGGCSAEGGVDDHKGGVKVEGNK